MKFQFVTFLAVSELLVLIQYTRGLLMQPSRNHHHVKTASSKNVLPRSAPSPSRRSLPRVASSTLSPYSKSASSPYSVIVLHAEKRNDRIFKAGGGVPQVPTGELKLFDPGEQGMKGGTMDLAERLKSGVGYHQGEEQSNGASSSSSQPAEPELSLFDPGEEGMKGGTSDFAERLKSGANYRQVSQQPIDASLSANGTGIEQLSGASSSQPAEPELSLFDPGEEGMKGGTSDFAERLKSGANYGQVSQPPIDASLPANGAGVEQPNEASSSQPELSLFDPGEEGMKGGTSDFAERLKSGANYEQVSEQPIDTNGAVPSSPEPVAPVEKPPKEPVADAEAAKPTNLPFQRQYRRVVASSSPPAYPSAGVGRGRAAAILRSYQKNGISPGSVPSAAQRIHPIIVKNKNANNGASTPTNTVASPDDSSEQASTAANEQQGKEEPKAPAVNQNHHYYWGKQSNWWDNANGSTMIGPN